MSDKSALLYLDNQLCFPLYAASRMTTKVYNPLLSELDITYPQYLVLLVLWQYEEKTVKEIGELLLLESNTLTPLLKRLESKDMIVRHRSSDDERVVKIKLTKKGEQLKTKAMGIPEKILATIGEDSFSKEELLQFQKTLLKFIGVLSQKTSLQIEKDCDLQ